LLCTLRRGRRLPRRNTHYRAGATPYPGRTCTSGSRQLCLAHQWKDPEEEVVYLIASLPAGETAPEALLCANRGHWGIEIMHRNKDVILGEDGYTNRSDNAPRNIFSLIGFALNILKSVSPSPTRAIEQFQDDRNKALRLFSG
jgi:predicted transposase YbfD/YdcC